jgi:hypothetical protein
VKLVNPSRSVNTTATRTGSSEPNERPPSQARICRAFRPSDDSTDGRRSTSFSMERFSSSTGGATRNGRSWGDASHSRSTNPISTASAARSGSRRIDSARRVSTVRRKDASACSPAFLTVLGPSTPAS